MKDEILGLESDFANNEYFGTNVWTEEKYRVLSGKIPVLLSAPHSVNQLRGDDVRSAEKYTGALTRYLSSSTSSYAIFQLFTHADPNMDVEHNYKNAIVNLIESYGIKLLIDIHSSNFSDDSDIDVVTNQKTTLCGFDDIPEKIKKIGLKYDVKVDGLDRCIEKRSEYMEKYCKGKIRFLEVTDNGEQELFAENKKTNKKLLKAIKNI